MAAAWVGFRRLFAISAVSSPPLATAVPASESGFRRLFSISAFSPSLPAAAPPAAEPSTNLFVSGKTPCHFVSPFLPLLDQDTREIISIDANSILYTARVVTDRVSGYSKGFGFVRYATLEEAEAGIEGMDGKAQTTPTRTNTASDSSSTTSTGNGASGYQ
ncbi:hypothetical protein B296_00008429 [Ensete ventricosum]|uniref:RRM domain-containing protein n=1 Tax=Ensete ventricosum TaxID=4639 RepID=A0A427BAR5_ENSVE|nr:hypothetical protein B296_00008429 [Ensete ventricosum]